MGEESFSSKLGSWLEAQALEEPDLLGSYQNRSLGTRLSGEALLFEGWKKTEIREPAAF